MKNHRIIIIIASAISVIALLAISFRSFAPWLVWNGSNSAPIGLYRIEYRVVQLGEFALVEPPKSIAALIAKRRYLPPGTPLIKRVSGLSGDEICRINERILINKTHVADALLFDSMGRKMPVWSGCFELNLDEVFLLNAPIKSFDGRYLGVTKTSEIIGVSIPLWTKTDASLGRDMTGSAVWVDGEAV